MFEGKIASQEPCFPGADYQLDLWQTIYKIIHGTSMVKMSMSQKNLANWQRSLTGAPRIALVVPNIFVSTSVRPSCSFTRKQLTIPNRVSGKRFLVS
jgi:hypothetical protein